MIEGKWKAPEGVSGKLHEMVEQEVKKSLWWRYFFVDEMCLTGRVTFLVHSYREVGTALEVAVETRSPTVFGTIIKMGNVTL